MKLKLLFLSMLFSVVAFGQATLPVNRTTWNAGAPTGWTDNGIPRTTIFACSGSNGGSMQLAGKSYKVFFTGIPDVLTYSIKGSNPSTGSFKVQESLDGVTWTDVAVYTSITGSTCIGESKTLLSTSRYVQFILITKTAGNVDIDDVNISTPPTLTPTVNSSTTDVTVTYGTAFTNYTITATQSPTSYTATGLPAGMIFNSTSGLISGTSSVVGTYPVSIFATNIIGAGTSVIKNYIINPKPLTITGLTSADKFFDGTTTATLTGTATLSGGLVGADVVTLSGSPTSNYSSASVGGPYVITTTGYTLSGADAAKYTVSQPVVTNRNIIAPIANDLCSSATNLVVNAAAVSGNMAGSTFTAPFTKKDVWYSFTPTCTGNHTITVAGFSGDVDIELFSGSCPATTTTLDSSAGTTSSENISISLTAGVTYYLRVLAFNVAAETSAFTAQVVANSTLALSNAGSPATGNIPAATTNAVIMGFTTTPGCTTSYDITTVKLTKSTVSTVATSDISNFRVVYDIDGNGLMNGVEASVSGAGTILWSGTSTFTLTGQTGITTTRKYLLVADIAAGAVNGRTIKVNISPSTDLTAVLSPAGTVTGTALGNTQTITPPVCTSATVASVTPSSGPVGTQVTITASSGSLLGATATFNGVAATVVSSSAIQLVVLVPVGATTGNLVITDTQPCNATVAFTVINNDITSCQGSFPTTTDLIIYEVHDEKTGSGGTVTLYNGTAASINLSNYKIYRRGTYGTGGAAANYATLTGSIASGALGILQVTASANACTLPASTNGTISGGFNDDDEISLRNSSGTLPAIDEVHTSSAGAGFYMVRNVGAYNPSSTFVDADWSITALATGVCDPRLGTLPVSGTSPIISTQPTVSLTCTTASAVLTVGATEGFVGGNALVYRWYYAAPGDITWTPILADGGFYTNSTTSSLTISPLASVQDYQYYCQVRENSATCYKATVAVQISGNYSTTWSGTAWSNGVPTLSKLAIIKGDYDMTLGGAVTSFDACSLLVKSPAVVTVTALKYINIDNNLTIDAGATVNILNNGSLVQINNAGVNTVNGTFNMQRTATVKQYDYVFWSSPTLNFPVANVSPTTTLGFIYKWTPTVATNFGTWVYANENMTKGKGYIVRTPTSFTQASGQTLTATFTGLPNNGIIPIGIERGDYQGTGYVSPANGYVNVTKYDDNENLVGNPYPSAIKASKFLSDPSNANIDGFVQVWSHGTQPSTSITDPFYSDYTYNYTANDFIVYNGTATSSGPAGFNGYIGAGQGFFVTMLDGAADATKSVTFNNGMRQFDYDNSQFYKSGNTNSDPLDFQTIDKSRIWLDLVSPTKQVNRMVVGYVDGATLGRDRIFDAVVKVVEKEQNFYTVLDNEPFQIQGRPLPFDNKDKVALGLNLIQTGNYSIAIGASDGLFLDKKTDVYLEDKKLNIIHDLKVSPYLFTGEIEKSDDRFVLRYNNRTIEPDATGNDVIVTNGNNQIGVKSQLEKIKDIVVFDVLERLVYIKNNINAQEFFINDLNINNQALIVKVTLENNKVVVKKILF